MRYEMERRALEGEEKGRADTADDIFLSTARGNVVRFSA